MYCTPLHLAEAKLARELAQVATPERMRIVDDALMDAALRGGDVSAYDTDAIAACTAALEVINTALGDADQVIDGYLLLRKPVPYTVPLNPVPGIVRVWARWIARYLLHKDRINTEERTDPIVRDYKSALEFLAQVRDGKFALGVDDPLPPAGGGIAQFEGAERQFTMDSLREFGAP